MPSIPPKLIRRVLVVDVVMALGFISLSLYTTHQVWRVIWGFGALVSVIDALVANGLLGEEEN